MGGTYDAFDVAVPGGRLTAGRWAGTEPGPVVLAVHGVTANHQAWRAVAAATPYPLVAPDLRGRGRSSALDGPAGVDAHTADLIAVLDHLEVESAVLVGHSMGGFVVAALAAAHPDRVRSVLLIDGGLPLPPPPPEMSADEVIAALIGPAAQRLAMTFTDAPAYRQFWRPHPALHDDWSADIEAYLDYDLVGTPPDCRSSVSADAVREDSVDLLDFDKVTARVRALPEGTAFLRAPSGLMAEPGGLYPADLAAEHARAYPRISVRDVPGTNHYTLVMAPHGAMAVAAAMAESATG